MKPDNDNVQYCLCFLFHGGERLRAIKLAVDALGTTVPQARDYVQEIAANYGKRKRSQRREYEALRAQLNAQNPSDYPV